MKNPRFIISGGGTGGHIYPAIAIANELKSRFPAAEFLFVGAKDKMEMQKVPVDEGYMPNGMSERDLMFDDDYVNAAINPDKVHQTSESGIAGIVFFWIFVVVMGLGCVLILVWLIIKKKWDKV